MTRKRSARATTPQAPAGAVVALTGVSDFLGAGLLRRLEQSPAIGGVVALDTRLSIEPGPKVRFVRLDLTEPNAGRQLAAILDHERVDTLVHLAYVTNPTHHATWAHELESLGTAQVLDACAGGRVRKLVVRSHTCVYGANPNNPHYLTEDHPLQGNSRSRFVTDKVDAERQVARFASKNPGTLVTVLRNCSLVGPGVDTYVSRYLSRGVGVTLMGFDPLLQFVHVDDVLDAYELVLGADHRGPFNIVGTGVLPLGESLRLSGSRSFPLPHVLAYPLVHSLWTAQAVEAPAAFLDYVRFVWLADGSRARDELGFEPRYSSREALLSSVRNRSPDASTSDLPGGPS